MVLTGEVESAAKPTLRYQFIMPYASIVETTGAKESIPQPQGAGASGDGGQGRADGRVDAQGENADLRGEALPGMAEGDAGPASPVRGGNDRVTFEV